MSRYLVVGSRDITEYAGGESLFDLAESLGKNRGDVLLFLVENGVLSARKNSRIARRFPDLQSVGVRILADDVSCRSRGIDHLPEGIRLSGMDELADAIALGFDNIYWY
jgi:sulfur relay (sulfurtransferase) complex TusBCD TusD component (DsrE family)